MRRLAPLALCLVSLSLAACSSSAGAPPIGDEGAGGASANGSGSGGSDGGGAGGAGGKAQTISVGGGGGDDADCGGGVGKKIFVVSSENVLLSFDPKQKTFATIGNLNCPNGGLSSPFSMAVERTGTAFVLYSDGNIFKVSTTDASCQPSGYQRNQLGWEVFGMGFVAEPGNTERIYVIEGAAIGGTNNRGLGYIAADGKLNPVGNFDMGLTGRTAEVTGRGDGRLFAFFVDSGTSAGSSVAEIDKATAKVISNVPQSLPSISAWAFAHWGGSFYLFNASSGSKSRVHKYTPGKGTEQLVADAGYTIVGAGVSTCAPTIEPIE